MRFMELFSIVDSTGSWNRCLNMYKPTAGSPETACPIIWKHSPWCERFDGVALASLMHTLNLFVACIHHFPGFLYLLLQGPNCVLVLLAELQGGLNLCRIGDDFGIELATLLDEPFLIFCATVQKIFVSVSPECLNVIRLHSIPQNEMKANLLLSWRIFVLSVGHHIYLVEKEIVWLLFL